MSSEPPAKASIPPHVVDAALQQWGETGRHSTFNVSGQSMEPFLFAGDQVLLRHGEDNIRIGELVAYRQGDTLVVHRLLRVFRLRGERVMLLRGDNNDYPDPLIPMDKLVGRATAVIRGGRTYRIDRPLWRWASCFLALFARFPLTLEQWVGGMRRRWLPGRPAAGSARARRLVGRVFALPGRLLTCMLWKFAPHDRV